MGNDTYGKERQMFHCILSLTVEIKFSACYRPENSYIDIFDSQILVRWTIMLKSLVQPKSVGTFLYTILQYPVIIESQNCRIHSSPQLITLLNPAPPLHSLPSYLRYVLILGSLSAYLRNVIFPITIIHALIPMRATCQDNLVHLDMHILIIIVKIMSYDFLFFLFLQSPNASSLFSRNILPRTPY